MSGEESRVEWRNLVKGIRFRTTTVVLILVWLGLLAFYGFTSAHYNPAEVPREPVFTQQSVTPPATSQDTAPRSTGSIDTTQPPEPTTDASTEPSPRTSTGVPGRDTAPAETTVSVPPSVPTATSGVDDAP